MKLWPFSKQAENRESGGDFTDAVVRLIEAQAAGQAADAGSTAAVEAASGLLSRAFSNAHVDAAGWAQKAVTPVVLGQIGRDLVRRGKSMHVILVDPFTGVQLVPAASWHWEGNHDVGSWTVRATAYGPSTSTTWNLPDAGVVFVRWGSTPGQPYVGVGPTNWAHSTSRLNSELERSVADEVSGPIAQLLSIPQDGGDGEATDPLAKLKADIRTARGKALMLETTSAGWGEGGTSAPQRDWVANRLGPQPPAVLAQLRKDSFEHVLASTGTPPALFTDSDGTSQREAVRRWHQNAVKPLARILEHELTMKLETPVKLKFDTYSMDMVSRAQVVDKLVKAGVDLSTAMAAVGMLEG